MIYSRENDHYDVRLANNLLKACQNGTADFLNPMTVPYYTQDMITNQALRDAAQLQTLLNNAAHGTQYINYAPTYLIQDNKRAWMKNINKGDREVGCITYKGKDEDGNKRYEMMSPAKKINPGGVNESPMTQMPVPNIGINRQTPSLDPRDPKSIEKYITDVIGNYYNAAFTKTPYFPPQWGGRETEMLSKALNADPALALRASQQAYAQATSVKMENTVNQELNDNVRDAIKQGLPPFNTKKQDQIIGPVNVNGNGVPANGVPSNGVDFINGYYNGINGKSAAVSENTAGTLTQNGYIPYQTHNEKPKDIEKFLIEEYGNIMNASLTGTPYSGSVTPAQLKTLSSGIETKIANDPAFMSGIVNKAQQNVAGFNYMPYDKDEFIKRAQDPSSQEFKLLDQMVAKHVKDNCMRNKQSFNGEFQELSKDLAEKAKKTVAAKPARSPSTRAGGAKADGAKPVRNPSTRTTTAGAGDAKPEENAPTRASGASTGGAKKVAAPSAGVNAVNMEGRPSFLKEVTEFVTKNIVEKKPALVLVDTFLGSLVDKAKKIVYSGKPIANAFLIAANVLVPNMQLPIPNILLKAANQISTGVNHDANKTAPRGTAKPAAVKQETVKPGAAKPGTTAKPGTVKQGTAKQATAKQAAAKQGENARQREPVKRSARR